MRKHFAAFAACLIGASSFLVSAAMDGSSPGGGAPASEAPSPQMEPMQPAQPIQPLEAMKSPRFLTPEQQADRLYTEGMADSNKADKLQKEAASETDAARKAKLETKARDKYRNSIRKFAEATKKNPNHYSAWGYLGYAYRKTGDYASSLEACQKALSIQPNYTLAMEYRAETLLALNRIEEVKPDYISLSERDRALADELAAAIEKWVGKRSVDPAGVDPAEVKDFAQWASQRKQGAS